MRENINIGIVGGGYVGNATKLFGCKDSNDVQDIAIRVYDTDPEKCIPKGISILDLEECDIVFVCVPTPMNEDGSCHLDIVKSVVNDLSHIIDKSKIFIRSTVPTGTSKSLGVNFMPEFLTEANWEDDFKNLKNWIIGLHNENDKEIKSTIRSIFKIAKRSGKILHANVYYASTDVAETTKLVRNTFLATKVSFFNEIESFCKAKNVDYEVLANMVALDERINKSHMTVPGPDGKKGFGGTCFPKDINSFLYQMQEESLPATILDAVIFRNEKIDRPEKDWSSDKGRAVV